MDESVYICFKLNTKTAIIFNDDTADGLLTALKPDIYVKGGDYAHKVLPERPTVESYGGQVRLIDYLPNHSTTNLIQKIRDLPM